MTTIHARPMPHVTTLPVHLSVLAKVATPATVFIVQVRRKEKSVFGRFSLVENADPFSVCFLPATVTVKLQTEQPLFQTMWASSSVQFRHWSRHMEKASFTPRA